MSTKIERTAPTQDDIKAWLERTYGPVRDIQTQGLKLAGEVGEVCEAIGKRGDGRPAPPEGWDARLRDEIADVVLAATAIAATEGFDLQSAMAAKWARVQAKYAAEPCEPKGSVA